MFRRSAARHARNQRAHKGRRQAVDNDKTGGGAAPYVSTQVGEQDFQARGTEEGNADAAIHGVQREMLLAGRECREWCGHGSSFGNKKNGAWSE